MKKLVLFALCAIFSMGVLNAQTPKNETENLPGPKISFTSIEHNYGTIEKGANGNCEFEFTNTGDEPLILSGVRASCGCTTPSYTQAPVMPGKKGIVKVHYNTNNVGGFNKSVTVTSNAVNDSRVTLKIKGNVVATENTQQ
ncbi:MAG: DUF1573 domain-containing protein [Bacteroidales bacterium]|nr:DUF1573 domain-containing protein [Candidatus Colimorpha onthohippi]